MKNNNEFSDMTFEEIENMICEDYDSFDRLVSELDDFSDIEKPEIENIISNKLNDDYYTITKELIASNIGLSVIENHIENTEISRASKRYILFSLGLSDRNKILSRITLGDKMFLIIKDIVIPKVGKKVKVNTCIIPSDEIPSDIDINIVKNLEMIDEDIDLIIQLVENQSIKLSDIKPDMLSKDATKVLLDAYPKYIDYLK